MQNLPPLATRWLALVLLGLLGACGGSSAPPLTDFGRLPLVPASVLPVPFASPLVGISRIEQAGTEGPFSIQDELPVTVQEGATIDLGVRFQPGEAGPASGSITLSFDNDTEVRTQVYRFEAEAEPVSWALDPGALDFGTVSAGTSATRSVRIQNTSQLNTVTLRDVQVPSLAYAIDPARLPVVVGPGVAVDVEVEFTPSVGGNHNGTLRLGPSDLGGPLPVPVLGLVPGGGQQLVTDFGPQSLDAAGRTGLLSIDVPSDAISLTVEALGNPDAILGLGQLIGPGGRLYENLELTGPYVWLEAQHAFGTSVPNTDRSALQLVPGGGTYQFRMRRMAGSGDSLSVRAIIETRPGGTNPSGTLDLNVWLASGTPVSAATAPLDARLQGILARIDVILRARGIVLGAIDYYDVLDPAFDEVTSPTEFGQLLETTSAATHTRLNLFFVNRTLTGRVVGAAATVSGPARNGTRSSGVMSVFEGFSINLIGLVAAHEMGHFLGLFHTAEEDGTHDIIDDTPNCPATGTSSACPVEGGELLMHWRALGGVAISSGQGTVLRAHPLLSPGGEPPQSKLTRNPWLVPFTDADRAEIQRLPAGWCGTCAGCQGKRR